MDTRAFEAGRRPPCKVIYRPSASFEDFIVRGDEVVVPGHVALRIKTTGKTCETDFLHLFTVRDGKLIRWRDYFDTFALAQAYMT
jgi:ketosteroid isomerase-like protein